MGGSMEERMIFRRVLFGGFHKGEVLDYIENLEAEKENLKLSLQDVQKEADEYKQKLSEMDEKYQASAVNMEEELEKARRETAELTKQLQEAEAEKNRLLRRVNERPYGSASGSVFDIRLSKLQTEARTIINDQKKDSENILAALRSDMMAVIERYRKKEDESNRKITELRDRTDDLNDVISQMGQELEEANQKLQEQALALDEKEQELAAQEQVLAEQERTVREYADMITGKDAELADMQKMMDDAKAQLDTVSAESMRQKKQIFELKEQQAGAKMPEQSNISYKYVEQKEKEAAREEEPELMREADSNLDTAAVPESELDAIFMNAVNSLNKSRQEAQNRLYGLSR